MNAVFSVSVAAAAILLFAGLFLDEERHAGILKLLKFSVSLAVLLAVAAPCLRFLADDLPALSPSIRNEKALSSEEIWNEAERAAIDRMRLDAEKAFPDLNFTVSGIGENGLRGILVKGDENAAAIASYLEIKYGIPCRGEEAE